MAGLIGPASWLNMTGISISLSFVCPLSCQCVTSLVPWPVFPVEGVGKNGVRYRSPSWTEFCSRCRRFVTWQITWTTNMAAVMKTPVKIRLNQRTCFLCLNTGIRTKNISTGDGKDKLKGLILKYGEIEVIEGALCWNCERRLLSVDRMVSEFRIKCQASCQRSDSIKRCAKSPVGGRNKKLVPSEPETPQKVTSVLNVWNESPIRKSRNIQLRAIIPEQIICSPRRTFDQSQLV